jgi:hypothetical protein
VLAFGAIYGCQLPDAILHGKRSFRWDLHQFLANFDQQILILVVERCTLPISLLSP